MMDSCEKCLSHLPGAQGDMLKLRVLSDQQSETKAIQLQSEAGENRQSWQNSMILERKVYNVKICRAAGSTSLIRPLDVIVRALIFLMICSMYSNQPCTTASPSESHIRRGVRPNLKENWRKGYAAVELYRSRVDAGLDQLKGRTSFLLQVVNEYRNITCWSVGESHLTERLLGALCINSLSPEHFLGLFYACHIFSRCGLVFHHSI